MEDLPSDFPVSNVEWQSLWTKCVSDITSAPTHIQRQIGAATRLPLPSGASNENLALVLRGAIGTLIHEQETLLLRSPVCPTSLALDSSNNATIAVRKVQNYLEHLSYNHLGNTFFVVCKTKSMHSLMALALQMIEHALPLKCLEAALLAARLTLKVPNLDRFMLAFKTSLNNNIYRHIVLVVRIKLHEPQPTAKTSNSPRSRSPSPSHRTNENKTVFGALGLSRRKSLMWKEPIFTSLAQLVLDFQHEYKQVGHTLLKIKIGGLITHTIDSIAPLPWVERKIFVDGRCSETLTQEINTFARSLKH